MLNFVSGSVKEHRGLFFVLIWPDRVPEESNIISYRILIYVVHSYFGGTLSCSSRVEVFSILKMEAQVPCKRWHSSY
jgi:hypothetical protein